VQAEIDYRVRRVLPARRKSFPPSIGCETKRLTTMTKVVIVSGGSFHGETVFYIAAATT
jgi:hypothetical protein